VIPFIGLTGGIGAGKSTALDALERLGAACLSTDAVVHDLYESAEVRAAVADQFGPVVLRDGAIDRAELARAAFACGEQRAWLEQLLWPLVGQRMMSWRAALESRTPEPRAAVVEVPLLFESGMGGAFDATIAVIAAEPIREGRASGRGHEALDQRAARQLSQTEKSERATYTVVNDGTVAELEHNLSAILDMLHQ
jgi:dephospho-CoA kinase